MHFWWHYIYQENYGCSHQLNMPKKESVLLHHLTTKWSSNKGPNVKNLFCNSSCLTGRVCSLFNLMTSSQVSYVNLRSGKVREQVKTGKNHHTIHIRYQLVNTQFTTLFLFLGQASISISVSNSQIQENVVWPFFFYQFPTDFNRIYPLRWWLYVIHSYRILVQCTRFLLMKCWDLGSLE